jgi:hypothetical protein
MPNDRRLSKQEFVSRVAERAAAHGVSFNATRLNEWIKRRLIPGAEWEANQGRRRIYFYDCRHYRRALQLVRLYSLGIVDKDAMLVQLFIRGYSVRPRELRRPLLSEFRRVRAQISRDVRSIYADRAGEIPPGHEESFLAQFGPADPRYSSAGVVPSSGQLIRSMRDARSPGMSSERPFDGTYKPLMESFAGILEPLDGRENTEVEKMILNAADEEFLGARAQLAIKRLAMRKDIRTAIPVARRAIEIAIIAPFRSREYAALILVATLRSGRT